MNQKLLVIGLLFVFITISISGCFEQEQQNILKVNVQNNASYHIMISIDFIGENFTFSREMQVDRGKINSVSIPMTNGKDTKSVSFTITATYVDYYPDVNDVNDNTWSLGYSTTNVHEFYYKIYGVIDSNNSENSSIMISGPLGGFD